MKEKNYLVVCNGGETPRSNSQLKILNKQKSVNSVTYYHYAYIMNEKEHYSSKHAESPLPGTDLTEIIEKLETVYEKDKNKKPRIRKRKKRTLKTKLKTVDESEDNQRK